MLKVAPFVSHYFANAYSLECWGGQCEHSYLAFVNHKTGQVWEGVGERVPAPFFSLNGNVPLNRIWFPGCFVVNAVYRFTMS